MGRTRTPTIKQSDMPEDVASEDVKDFRRLLKQTHYSAETEPQRGIGANSCDAGYEGSCKEVPGAEKLRKTE